MNGVYDQRALHRRQRPQTRIGTFEFLHNEAVCRVAKTSAAVSFQIRRIKAQHTHARYQMFRELARTVKRDNLTHDFLLDKTPGPIARGAFFVREKLFNAVIIQRGHVVGTRSHARKFNEHPTRRQRLAARLSLVSCRAKSRYLSLVLKSKRFDSLTSPSLSRRPSRRCRGFPSRFLPNCVPLRVTS